MPSEQSRHDLDTVRDLLLAQRWIFARTMPANPHEYTLRKLWTDDADFVRTVQFIRRHGYQTVYEGRPYTQFDLNGHFYWTMGAAIEQTTLINRKQL
jgi:hypothetical protein